MTVAFDDNEAPRMLAEWREQIAVRLNRDRPTRYSRADNAWMEPTISWARAHQPLDDVEVVRLAARIAVVDQEARANRKANSLIKRYARSGCVVLVRSRTASFHA